MTDRPAREPAGWRGDLAVARLLVLSLALLCPGALSASHRGLEQFDTSFRQIATERLQDVLLHGVDWRDALTVELHAMRTNVMRVEAPVSGWVGRGADRKPKVIELGVYLRSDADRFDQDLAAVGLVVGKYVLRYGYEVQRLEVVFEGLSQGESRIKVNPESARLFYLGRKDLLQFLQTR